MWKNNTSKLLCEMDMRIPFASSNQRDIRSQDRSLFSIMVLSHISNAQEINTNMLLKAAAAFLDQQQ